MPPETSEAVLDGISKWLSVIEKERLFFCRGEVGEYFV